MSGTGEDPEVDESRALFFSMAVADAFAVAVLSLRFLYGPLLDPVFEITVFYLPAALLTAMYLRRVFRENG